MPINQFFVNTELSSPATLAVGPNDDTLYGLVWLDLTRGPQVIGVPDTHGRYYSIQLIDFWTNPFAYIGYRTTGTEAGAFAITPPGYRGRLPRGVKEVPATTKRLLGLVRTLVNDPADLPAAQAIQTSYTAGSLDRHPFGRVSAVAAPNSGAFNIFVPIDLTGDGIDLYEEINQGILEYPPLPADARYARTLRPVGVDVERYRQPDASLRRSSRRPTYHSSFSSSDCWAIPASGSHPLGTSTPMSARTRVTAPAGSGLTSSS